MGAELQRRSRQILNQAAVSQFGAAVRPEPPNTGTAAVYILRRWLPATPLAPFSADRHFVPPRRNRHATPSTQTFQHRSRAGSARHAGGRWESGDTTPELHAETKTAEQCTGSR